MASRTPLTAGQWELLQRIVRGSPPISKEDAQLAVSVYALRNRRLVQTPNERSYWQAAATELGQKVAAAETVEQARGLLRGRAPAGPLRNARSESSFDVILATIVNEFTLPGWEVWEVSVTDARAEDAREGPIEELPVPTHGRVWIVDPDRLDESLVVLMDDDDLFDEETIRYVTSTDGGTVEVEGLTGRIGRVLFVQLEGEPPPLPAAAICLDVLGRGCATGVAIHGSAWVDWAHLGGRPIAPGSLRNARYSLFDFTVEDVRRTIQQTAATT